MWWQPGTGSAAVPGSRTELPLKRLILQFEGLGDDRQVGIAFPTLLLLLVFLWRHGSGGR